MDRIQLEGRNKMRYTEAALQEKEFLGELNKKPFLARFWSYFRLSGPGFFAAAFTLGAGSFTSSISLGAGYGYSMLWVPLYSFGFGLFMLALAARFVTSSEVPIIQVQNKFHGKLIGSIFTGLIACFIASVVYSFGQYALASDALISMGEVVGFTIPKTLSWMIIAGISIPLTFIYGKGGNPRSVKIVENVMKILILIMLIVFGAILFTTGINIPALLKGLFIPSIPSGLQGILIIIASLSATIGVMDWVLFNNSMYNRGFSENHETLGRFDAFMGGLLPSTLVLTFVSVAFAEVFAGKPGIPTNTTELADALVATIPSVLIQVGFYIGILALVISTLIGLSVVAATTFCQSLNLEPDPKKWYWKALLLSPHIGFLGSYIGKPVLVVITVAAMQSLFNWLSGNSWYLLGNDRRFLGDRVIKSRFFNVGILITLTILNLIFVTFVLSKIGVWPE